MVLTIVLAAGCATAGTGAGDDDDADAGLVNLVDGGPGSADAPPGAPDAAPLGCNLVTQSGCMAGQACDLGDMNAPECREVTSPGTEDDTCLGNTGCAAGYSCINSGASSCMKYCGSDANCTGVGSICIITLVDAMQVPIPGVTLCSQSCDPISSSGCPATWGCHIYQETAAPMRTLTQCELAGASGQGGSCVNGNADCQAGFTCFCTDAACTTNNKCFKTCNATDNIGCVGATTCQGVGTVLGGKEYGGCV